MTDSSLQSNPEKCKRMFRCEILLLYFTAIDRINTTESSISTRTHDFTAHILCGASAY
uniref:Uncharacterized protein n=1 Tax=Arundo donax TaxID=35708 RepID=A0A0A9C3E4_ARUDO